MMLNRRLILIGASLITSLPVLAQTPDLFEPAAPPPSRAPARVARPEPESPMLQPVTPTPPASQKWEGTTGIWHVEATVNGQKVTGRIECFLNGKWTDW